MERLRGPGQVDPVKGWGKNSGAKLKETRSGIKITANTGMLKCFQTHQKKYYREKDGAEVHLS